MLTMANRTEDDENRIDDGKLPLLVLQENIKNAAISQIQSKQIQQNEAKSSTRGLINQILLTIAILILTAGCGMPIGYSVVILPQLYNSTDPLKMDIEIGSWFASVHSLATPFGAFASGPIMDYFGRKPALFISSVPLILGWLSIANANTHWILLTGRILAGFAVGLIAAPCQILIAECVDPSIRGFTIGAPYVSYSLGILLTYSLGVVLHWRHVAWCSIVLPILSIICLYFVPESPSWLARNGKVNQAEKALKWLRCNDAAMKHELKDLIDRLANERNDKTKKVNILRECKSADVLKPLVIINGFHVFLIFSGTYLIVFYAVDIISELGVQVNSMNAAVLTALVRLICTLIFCFLLFYIKRRTLILFASIGSTISSLVLALFIYFRIDVPKTSLDLYVSAGCILFYVAANTGCMVMPGIMVGELIPARVRGRIAGSIYAIFNMILFCVIKLFPQFANILKTHGIFCMFAVGSFCGTILLYLMLPETKTISLGQIEDYFRQGNWIWSAKKLNENKKLNECKA